MKAPRRVTLKYQDPLDVIWVETARRIGMVVARSDDVFASWDGEAEMRLARADHLDPDDCLAQMILHEICHGLVEGKTGMGQEDWGLDNRDERDAVREFACQRVQAALADRHGLRQLLAPTTDYGAYYAALPADPLAPGCDPAVPLAVEAWDRARHGPWAEPLERALAATAELARTVGAFVGPDSLWGHHQPLHPTGFPAGPGDGTCGNCAWRARLGPGKPVDRCRQSRVSYGRPGTRIEPNWPGCTFWEPVLTEDACGACGACCREGFHRVPVSARDPLRKSHPHLVAVDEHGRFLPRPDGRCVALEGAPPSPYLCTIYEDRPRHCVDFEVGGDACLEARQRVGISGRPR